MRYLIIIFGFSTFFLVDANTQVDYSQKQMFVEREKRMDNNYHETVNNYGAQEASSPQSPQPFTQPVQPPQLTRPPQPEQEPQDGHRGLAIASLVIGILSMTLLCFLGSIVGTAGLILGIIALCKKQKPIGLSIAGIVTSAIGLICGIVILVFMVGGGGRDLAEKLREARHSTVPVPYETETETELPEEFPSYDDSLYDETQEDGETSAGQLFEGKSFTVADSTKIYFNEDMTYVWYRDDKDHSDNYHGGTYIYYTGQEAMDYLMTDLAEYGAKEDRLYKYFDENTQDRFHTLKNMCVISMTVDEMVYDGEVTYPAKVGHYMGFYKDGIYEGVHMGSFNQVLFQEDK